MDQPGFQTPVAQAQELGLKIYWLGEEFEVGSETSQITADADLLNTSGVDYGASLSYGLSSPRLSLHTYPLESEEARVWRERIAGLERSPATSVVSEGVTVGPWQGELFTVSAGARPVNQLWLFIDVGDAIISANAAAGMGGIPGEDPNPLIQADVLIDTVVRYLRPYPE